MYNGLKVKGEDTQTGSKLGARSFAEYSDMLKAEGHCGYPIYGEFPHVLVQMRFFYIKGFSSHLLLLNMALGLWSCE